MGLRLAEKAVFKRAVIVVVRKFDGHNAYNVQNWRTVRPFGWGRSLTRRAEWKSQ
jgi:hypothetical protein